MERRTILVTHGNFTTGIQTLLALIYGKAKNAECLYAYMEQPYDLAKMTKDILKNNQQNELTTITDLFGGSVSNGFFNYMGKQAIHPISGLDLTASIEVYTRIDTVDSLVDLVKHTVESGQEGLCYCNELFSKEILEEEFQEEMERLNC